MGLPDAWVHLPGLALLFSKKTKYGDSDPSQASHPSVAQLFLRWNIWGFSSAICLGQGD